MTENSKRKGIFLFAMGIILGRYGVPFFWHVLYITVIICLSVASCDNVYNYANKMLDEKSSLISIKLDECSNEVEQKTGKLKGLKASYQKQADRILSEKTQVLIDLQKKIDKTKAREYRHFDFVYRGDILSCRIED